MIKKVYQMYRDFHGHSPRNKGIVDFIIPEELVILGDAVSVTYATDKKNGGGDGKYFNYKHEFESPCILATDRTGKQLYILGDKLKVTKAGIEN